TKLSKIQFHSKIYKQAENIRKMILAMSKDIRVLLVKLADRLHNMRTLEYQKEYKRVRIARETMDIYAPLAGRLGIDKIKVELEDLAFLYIYPQEYQDLRKKVKDQLGERKAYVEEVKGLIAKKMADFGLPCKVTGRPKHLYSIFRKMRRRNVSLGQIYDLIAFRILVKSLKECYEALGIVHSLWKQVPGRFKDYISLPKTNMYQSLHTTVIGPYGERMEIQIRTEEMDKVANEGIAAHWLYKEGKIISKEKEHQFDWLHQLMEWQKELEDPREFLESVKMDLFPNEVYVFTPRGEVKEFPRGATPIDFAYAIHTDVGHHCSGARINGRMVPLKQELRNGDIVEIITSEQHVPSRDWLKFVKTSKARARIRQWIRKSLVLGKELCVREFKRHRLDFNELMKTKGPEIAKIFSFKTPKDMILAVGYGKISPSNILRKVIRAEQPEGPEPSEEKEIKVQKHAGTKGQQGILIHGLDDILIHLGQCCTPIPNDEVVGYITKGRGVTIHRENCANVRNLDPERRVEVTWDPAEGATYPVRVQVVSADQKGMLAAVSNAISAEESNILKARVTTTPNYDAVFNFTIEVRDRKHLSKVLSDVRKIKGVIRIKRLSS
ncbi:MAG: RelA/SpoT family protein, partial [Nitrospiraceae bacterium]|nr:RelA/SpoT family protein [Nitrospiraceae bacterium]